MFINKVMNFSMSRLLKSAYRKEPISALIVIFGTVDALLGGLNERWTLLSLGILLICLGVSVRWLQTEKAEKRVKSSSPRRYLNPSRSSLQPLPELKSRRKPSTLS